MLSPTQVPDGANLEWHTATLRILRGGDDPYAFVWACTIMRHPIESTTAVVIGALTAPPLGRLREIGKALLAAGFATVTWRRLRRDRDLWLRHDLTKFRL